MRLLKSLVSFVRTEIVGKLHSFEKKEKEVRLLIACVFDIGMESTYASCHPCVRY